MNRLAQLIEEMPYEDLLKLQRDLKAGNLDRLLNRKVDALTPSKTGICPVCNATVGPNALTLTFGKEIRQRASFDGVDCLEYFLKRLKKQM